MGWLLGLFSPITSIISGWFGLKGQEAAAKGIAIGAAATVGVAAAKTGVAEAESKAQIVASENATTASEFTRNWRPIVGVTFGAFLTIYGFILLLAMFGIVEIIRQPAALDTVIFGMFSFLGVYSGGRTLEKITEIILSFVKK